MHWRLEAELLQLDFEIEKPLKNLKKMRTTEEEILVEHIEANQNNNVVENDRPPQRQRTMEDFWRPVIREKYSVVRQLPIKANNFELKLVLITMVQQDQFTSHISEDPNDHLGRFLRMANTVKLNVVNLDVIKLQLFPFSLRDIAASWFESLPYGSMRNWEELVEAYLSRFFPHALTFERR